MYYLLLLTNVVLVLLLLWLLLLLVWSGWGEVKRGRMGDCTDPMFLLMDNSDSPYLVEQLQQDVILIVIPLLVIVPSSMMCLMPYACQLASCSMGISNYSSCLESVTLCFLCPLFSSPLLPSLRGSEVPFIQGVSLLNPGIACLTMCTLG